MNARALLFSGVARLDVALETFTHANCRILRWRLSHQENGRRAPLAAFAGQQDC